MGSRVSARILFGYAVLLLGLVLTAFVLADGPAGKWALIGPGIGALVVAGISAAVSTLSGRPQVRLLLLRMGATLPLIVGASLAMRATRLGHRIAQGDDAVGPAHALIWTMAIVSLVVFLLMQYQRFRHGNR